MKLICIKIRGLGQTPETGWIDLAPTLNVLHFPSRTACQAFLTALQTINPPYDCRIVEPFADFPETIRKNGYTRIIRPHKRTISLAVFNSTPSLVRELADTSPILYETDRIEIGRRLDYSRWVNFVELASSTRWSEVSDDINTLMDQAEVKGIHSDHVRALAEDLGPTDRIKAGLINELEAWLKPLLAAIQEERQRIESVLEKVRRAADFAHAIGVVKKRAPLFFLIDGQHPPSPTPVSDQESVRFLLSALDTHIAQQPHAKKTASNLLEKIRRNMAHVLPDHGLTIDYCRGTCTLTRSDSAKGPPHCDNHALNHLLAVCSFVIAAATALYEVAPILLINVPAHLHDDHAPEYAATFFTALGRQSQCVLTVNERNGFTDLLKQQCRTIEDISA